MILPVSDILLIGSILLLLSIIAGKTTSRFGVPTLLLFIAIGMLAGSEGIGKIYFDNPYIAQLIGVTALNFILFSGGLDTNLEFIKPIIWRGVALSTIGVFVTAFTVGLFAHYLIGFTWLEGLLLGSIVSSTDAAAVFSILRQKGVALKGYLRPTLELESGSNDPMAYFLTISFTTLLMNPEMTFYQLVPLFLKGFTIGAIMGYAMGKISTWLINFIKLDNDGVYPVLVLGLAMFTYAATDFIGGNGFLAIYMCAVILGNSNFIHRRALIKFYDGQAWLMQIILFLTLGLLLFPSNVISLAGIGILISVFLILVARPLGVFASLLFFKTSIRSRMFLSWVGLRGAVPIVFATYPLMAGLPKSEIIFNLVFFISITSVLLQGTSLAFVAKLLRVSLPQKAKRRSSLDIELTDNTKSIRIELELTARHKIGKRIVELDFPKSAQIMSIERDDEFVIPNGSTRLLVGDKLLILAEDERSEKGVYDSLGVVFPEYTREVLTTSKKVFQDNKEKPGEVETEEAGKAEET